MSLQANNSMKQFHRRGTLFQERDGKHGTCEDCPIKTKAGMQEQESRSNFIGKTLELGIHKSNTITTTDVLWLDYHSPAGGLPRFSLGKRGHTLDYNGPGELRMMDEEVTVEDMFRTLALDQESRIDVGDEGTIFIDEPFVSSTGEVSNWETIHKVVQQGGKEWEFTFCNFSPTRIRYFVGSINPSEALHRFVERIPRGSIRGSINDQRVRLKHEDSLLVWLPSPQLGSEYASSWEERLGADSKSNLDELIRRTRGQRNVLVSIIDGYPGVFMLVKRSSDVLSRSDIRRFLLHHGHQIDRRIQPPLFVQDLDSIRFFWDGSRHTGTDTGGVPEFLLDAGDFLDLLVQASKNSPRPREGSGRNEKEVIFSAIESEIFIHNVGGGHIYQ